jgi:hypothetical protein
MWTERVDGRVERKRVCRRLCVVPIVTSMESVAGELGKNLHTRGECHSALKENIRICFSKILHRLTTNEAVIANGTSLHDD